LVQVAPEQDQYLSIAVLIQYSQILLQLAEAEVADIQQYKQMLMATLVAQAAVVLTNLLVHLLMVQAVPELQAQYKAMMVVMVKMAQATEVEVEVLVQ
jgi:hypothetical protein